jgi:hypothetical protein
MASFWDRINPLGSKSFVNPIANKSFRGSMSNMFFGSPEKHKRVSTLTDEQQPLLEQLIAAGLTPGAGGAFGQSADYYRDLLSDDSQTAQAMFAPEQRRFNEDIIPGLSEQFAGMGAGNLASSGFRNAAVNAGTDLSERLAAIRANLRSQGASGLSGIGQAGLGNYSQDVMTQPGSEGLLSSLAPAIGSGIGMAVGGPIGAGIGGGIGTAAQGALSRNSGVAQKRSPYTNQAQSSSIPTGGGFQLPNFNFR